MFPSVYIGIYTHEINAPISSDRMIGASLFIDKQAACCGESFFILIKKRNKKSDNIMNVFESPKYLPLFMLIIYQ